MTAREFQREFEQAASFIDQLKAIRIISDDVNYFLNEGQHTYIHKRLENIRNKVEGSQKDIDELRNITVKDTTLVIDAVNSNTERDVYDLPANYLYLLNDRSTTIRCGIMKSYQNRLSPLENVHKLLDYTYTTTKYNDPVSALSGDKLYIYKDSSFTIGEVKIDYIREVADIDVIGGTTSELNENVHRDIIQLAINIFLENVQSGRFRSNIEKNVITEQVK